MNRLEIPANIKLMNTADPRIKSFPLIKSLDTFDGMNTNHFHPEGLFSTEIFGRVGTPERDRSFAFIHTKIPILNPFIFKKLIRLKGLYQGIITGKQYAMWDSKERDFVPSNLVEGETGYSFFIKHLSDIEFKLSESASRKATVDLVRKSISDGTCYVEYVPVYPAGLRDAYVGEDGRVTEDEVNPLYRSLLSAANALPDSLSGSFSRTPDTGGGLDDSIYNTTRLSLQNALNKIFEYFWQLFEGKRGFARSSYYSRGVFNGTRNVLTALITNTTALGVPHTPKLTNTVVGLYQTMKMVLPVTTHHVLNGVIGRAFNGGDGSAQLVNRKTLRSEKVGVSRATFDRFNTPEGINKLINGFGIRKNRHKPVIVDGHYLALIYRGELDGRKVFKIIDGIEDLPKGFSLEDVYPITWVELFYLSNYREWNKYPMLFTRYPVAGLGSTFFTYVYVKTTMVGEQRWELDEEWRIREFNDNNPIKYAYEYPVFNDYKTEYFETVALAPAYLAGAAAD